MEAASVEHERQSFGAAFGRPGRSVLKAAPLAAAALLAWLAVIVGGHVDWVEYAWASGLLVATGALPAFGVRDLRVGSVPASLLFLAALGLLRRSVGGIGSGIAMLSLIPVFYTALNRGNRALAAVIGATALFYVAPIVIVGGSGYPDSEYAAVLVAVVVNAIVGIVTQRLVARVRREAGEARSRELMLERLSEVVQRLSESSNVRDDVCESARSIGRAEVAVLYEPLAGERSLRASATAGLGGRAAQVPLDGQTAISEAFTYRRIVLVAQDTQERLGGRELFEVAGRPPSFLCAPLLRGAEPIGVLLVAWQDRVRSEGPRVHAVSLLAHEAAAVIGRADLVSRLADMARTDPLTGLPNRRAWDAGLQEAIVGGGQLTVAMLDLDHFKEFNDTRGHAAGDRLLRQAAGLWREQLRAGDLLARLGGEEFGLLLMGSDATAAHEVVERLRAAMPEQRTCSAGFAVRARGETSAELMARVDEALYSAKSCGRDRSCIAAERTPRSRHGSVLSLTSARNAPSRRSPA